MKEAKDERDAATKAAGVIQAKLDAANEDIEKNQVILVPRTVNGTGHTGPSEFCATSI